MRLCVWRPKRRVCLYRNTVTLRSLSQFLSVHSGIPCLRSCSEEHDNYISSSEQTVSVAYLVK